MRSILQITVVAIALMAIGTARSYEASAALEDYPDWAQEAFCPRSGGKCYP